MLIGQMYEAAKKKHGNHAERGKDGKYLSPQNGDLGDKPPPAKVSHQIAAQIGVGKNRVERGGQGGVLLMEKFPEANNVTARDELGAMAGVGRKTYEHAAVIESAPAPFPLRLTPLLSVTVSE